MMAWMRILLIVSVLINLVNSYNTFENRKPTFPECGSYKPMVKEEQYLNQPIINVTAIDPDPGQTIEYSLVLSPGELPYFRIDNNTGQITSLYTFDHDDPYRHREFYIMVRATDNGHPRLDDLCMFKVTIVDINDNAPVFEKSHYEVYVPMDMKVDQTVATIRALDIDEENNSQIRYIIIRSERCSRYFAIDEDTALLTLVNPIDHVFGENCKFHVLAYNVIIGSKEIFLITKVSVTMHVVPSTQLRPTFTKLPLESIVLNETYSNYDEVLAEFEAESNIPGMPEITFELIQDWTKQKNSSDTFVLEQNANNAIIKLHSMLDYEMKSEHLLIIRVTNSHNLVMETEIKIKVLDENDNIPMFTKVTWSSIPEHMPPGTPVIQVKAIDMDGTSANNVVSYRLNWRSGRWFHIDHQTGLITSLVEFDREAFDTYDVTVIAEDNSPSVLFRNGTSNIKITDINDHAPKFVIKVLEVENVRKNSEKNALVDLIWAYDLDAASVIKYSIISGNVGDAFKIDENTGFISVNSRLDNDRYELVVQADDGVFQENATVSIQVTSWPPFINLRNFTIQEEMIPERCIARISLYYAIIEEIRLANKEDHGEFLKTDEHGCIRLHKPLDRDPPKGFDSWPVEIIVGYKDDLYAQTIATMNIILEDINDNAPQLTNEMPVMWQMKQPPGPIVQLTAEDIDEPRNGPPFFFSIGPNASDEIVDRFEVNADVLYALIEFDREQPKEYQVPILIQDSGDVSMSNVSMLHVVIGDANDSMTTESAEADLSKEES